MGGLNTSKTKYVLLYGEPDSGKTLFQYQLQSNINLNTEEIKSTYGISYETLSIGDCELGMFDLSGSIKQYDIVKIVTKFVDISGIIFIVSLTTLDRIDESKDSLERILGNNFLSIGIVSNCRFFNSKIKQFGIFNCLPRCTPNNFKGSFYRFSYSIFCNLLHYSRSIF